MINFEDFAKVDVRVEKSEVLTLSVPDDTNECILITVDKKVAVVGGRLY